MGRTKGRHHNEEVRLRGVALELCRAVLATLLAYLAAPKGRHHAGVWPRTQYATVALFAWLSEIFAISARLVMARITFLAVKTG